MKVDFIFKGIKSKSDRLKQERISKKIERVIKIRFSIFYVTGSHIWI